MTCETVSRVLEGGGGLRSVCAGGGGISENNPVCQTNLSTECAGSSLTPTGGE